MLHLRTEPEALADFQATLKQIAYASASASGSSGALASETIGAPIR